MTHPASIKWQYIQRKHAHQTGMDHTNRLIYCQFHLFFLNSQCQNHLTCWLFGCKFSNFLLFTPNILRIFTLQFCKNSIFNIWLLPRRCRFMAKNEHLSKQQPIEPTYNTQCDRSSFLQRKPLRSHSCINLYNMYQASECAYFSFVWSSTT